MLVEQLPPEQTGVLQGLEVVQVVQLAPFVPQLEVEVPERQLLLMQHPEQAPLLMHTQLLPTQLRPPVHG